MTGNKKSIVCFGEVMLRLTAPAGNRLEQAVPGALQATFGGSEANVAVSLARLGTPVTYVTALPNNPMVDAFANQLRGLGVEVHVCRMDDCRLGIYYVEQGSNLRGAAVYYDRDWSGVSQADFEIYPFEKHLENASGFHISGITPALSKSAYETTLRAAKLARQMGVFVSCDLNFRSKLWRWKDGLEPRLLARECMEDIVKHVDLLVGNESDFKDCLGVDMKASNPELGELHVEDYRNVVMQVAQSHPNLKYISSSLRQSVSADVNSWGGMLYDCAEGCSYFAPMKGDTFNPYELTDIVDRFGAGDSFVGALLHALIGKKLSRQDALAFAVCASAFKHTISGDFNYISHDEVARLLQQGSAGRVLR